MKTINDLIVNGQMAQDYFLTKLGYDHARFQHAFINDKGDIRLYFDLEDNFQRDLPVETKYKCGYMTSIKGEDFWKRLEAWPTREQRELTILARKASALDADLDKIKSAQVQAFVAELKPTLDELRRQIGHNPNVEIE